jgi:hypothetical protein
MTTSQFPEQAPGATRIEQVRWVAEHQSARMVEGRVMDMQTATLLVKVHDALSPANQARFSVPSLERLVELAWRSTTAA